MPSKSPFFSSADDVDRLLRGVGHSPNGDEMPTPAFPWPRAAYSAHTVSSGTTPCLQASASGLQMTPARMAALALGLHQASAVVALNGTELGRRQGHNLYQVAKGVAASRREPTGDLNCPSRMIGKDDEALETAIDKYKCAVVEETTALP
jgi:hypothetical protein